MPTLATYGNIKAHDLDMPCVAESF